MHGSGNHKRRHRHNSLSSHLADDVTTIVTSVSGWRRAMGRSKLQQRYYDPKRVGSYGGVAALRRVVPEQDVERWLSEQDIYTLHKPVRRRFKRRCVVVGGPKPAVASRPSRHVAVEEGPRWNNIHTDCDRCVFQTSLVSSAKEQISSLVGGRLYTVAKQRGTEHIAN